MSRLLINGNAVEILDTGVSLYKQPMYMFQYDYAAEWSPFKMPDGTTGTLALDMTLDCTYCIDYEEDDEYVLIDDVKINKIVSKNPIYQEYFDKHAEEVRETLLNTFNKNHSVSVYIFRNIRLER